MAMGTHLRSRAVLLACVAVVVAQQVGETWQQQEFSAATAEQARRYGVTEDVAKATLSQMQGEDPDRYTLTLLNLLTGGDQWKCQRGQRNWMSSKPLGEWEGVTTNEDGRVTKLVRSWCNMKGPIPKSLFRLAFCTEVLLSGNHLTGSLPGEIGNLANLEKLGLGGNSLQGVLPVQSLAKLDKLETFLMHNNKFEQLPPPITNDRWRGGLGAGGQGGGLWYRNDMGGIKELMQKLTAGEQADQT